jgi:hypothetical protein
MKPRIYVILRGGLGNQLHQIAAGLAISERVNGLVRIYSHIVDTSINPSRRGFFREFNLSKVFTTMNLKEVGRFENLILRILVRIKYSGTKKLMISEENFDFFNPSLKCYLIQGWFQSHRYLPKAFNPAYLAPPVPLEECVATVHVRLTDFSSIDPNPLDSDYYQTAISRIKSMGEIKRFVCFSDDIPGAQKILNELEEMIFPEQNSSLSPDTLLLKMSSTKFLVCSRSSLSWWAAQIVTAKGGHVITPWGNEVGDERWFRVDI